MKKEWYITFKEKGVTYMQCKSCHDYVSVSEGTIAVTCGTCNARKIAWPKSAEQKVSSGRPSGWHFMNEFVDKDGNVFHKGKEQPDLKGTLSPTKIKPKKKAKRRTKEEILLARHEKKKKVLKKAKKKLNDKIKRQ